VSGIALDEGGLIALDRDDRRVIALIARATELGTRIIIPATCWRRQFEIPPGKPDFRDSFGSRSRMLSRSMRRMLRLSVYYWRGRRARISSTPMS